MNIRVNLVVAMFAVVILAAAILVGGTGFVSADDKAAAKNPQATPTNPQSAQNQASAPSQPSAQNPQAKAFADWQQQMAKMFDADGDGKLSDQEKLMAQEAMRRQGINIGMAPGGFPGEEQFRKQFDRNGDGQLDQMESMAAQAVFQRMRGGGGMRGGVRGGGGPSSGFLPQPAIPVGPVAGNGGTGKVSPLVKRFDKDGDGKLNADEKAAAQAELKKKDGKDVKKEKGKK